jgi:hypothetical protein
VNAEASAVLRAVVMDFFFNCWCLEISSDNCSARTKVHLHHAQNSELETF